MMACLMLVSSICSMSEAACTVKDGRKWVCNEQLADRFKLCPEGCYLVTETQMAGFTEALAKAALIPGIETNLERVTLQRDMAFADTSHALNRARIHESRAMELRDKLDSAYDWTDITVGVVGGVVVGVGVGVFVTLVMI